MSVLSNADVDLGWIKDTMEEQKKSTHDMQKRLQETKIRIHLLNEKTKKGTETIAEFAGGPDFEEFRKSIHVDDLVRVYQDEIHQLKQKNMDMERQINQ